jgi:ATP-dependent Clp protease adaptor protein ClpS
MAGKKDGWGDGPSWDTEDESGLAAETEKKVDRPRLYNVLLHNDDYTTMEFVVMVLMTVFRRPEDEAVRIMLHVHNSGVGIAGTYSYEVAETKAEKTMKLARENDYPLRASVEPL